MLQFKKSTASATFFSMLTGPAFAASEKQGQAGSPACLKTDFCRILPLNSLKKYPGSHQPHGYRRQLSFIFLTALLIIPDSVFCDELDWSIGGYVGQYYDSEPAGIIRGNGNFLDQYIVALTASRSVWRSQSLPLSLEIDGMIGHQFGLASLNEIAIAPVLRWSSFPWNETLQTDFRFGPLGVSYTTTVSPLEQGPDGSGSQTLNFLLIELAFSLPRKKSEEVFVRLHHRCNIYDLLNNYGANGEDFLALGYRQYF